MSTGLEPLSAPEMDAYLQRVGLDAVPGADREGVTALHHAHLFSIPFENLDIHLGREIVLDPDSVFDKLVTRRRGGFCYEHNSLFTRAVMALGLAVDLLSSRVASGPRGWGPPFDHMTLRIDLDEPWLLDVGFGDSYRDPLPIGRWQEDSNGFTYGAWPRDDGIVVQHRTEDPRLGRLYLTDLTPRHLDEFQPMCEVQQTSPDVWFTTSWVVTLALPDGRMTASPGSLTRTRQGIKHRTEVTGPKALQRLLRDEYGMETIEIPADFLVEPQRIID